MLGLGGSYGQKQSRIESILGVLPKRVGDDAVSEIVLSYIRKFPGIKTVHETRKIAYSSHSIQSSAERLQRNRDRKKAAVGTAAFAAAVEKAIVQGRIQHQDESAGSSTQRDASVPLPWGIDRLDQDSLPLDGSYNPLFKGVGINTFVVDSGLDTRHVEFSDGQSWHDFPSSQDSSGSHWLAASRQQQQQQ